MGERTLNIKKEKRAYCLNIQKLKDAFGNVKMNTTLIPKKFRNKSAQR